jgi:hypothetical protein
MVEQIGNGSHSGKLHIGLPANRRPDIEDVWEQPKDSRPKIIFRLNLLQVSMRPWR